MWGEDYSIIIPHIKTNSRGTKKFSILKSFNFYLISGMASKKDV